MEGIITLLAGTVVGLNVFVGLFGSGIPLNSAVNFGAAAMLFTVAVLKK